VGRIVGVSSRNNPELKLDVVDRFQSLSGRKEA